MKIKVTFPKLHRAPFFSCARDRYKLESFIFDCDPAKHYRDNLDAAFDEAVRRGHNPDKNIRFLTIQE